MKRKILPTGKATFRTTSRRLKKIEAGYMTQSVTFSWRRGKKLWNSTRVECCSCENEPSERKTRRSQTFVYQVTTAS